MSRITRDRGDPARRRHARAFTSWAAQAAGALSLAALAAAAGLAGCGGEGDAKPSLHLYAGAGLKPAMDEVIAAYTEQTGVEIVPDFAGSGIALSKIKASDRGDLFMPGDVWYVEQAAADGLVASKHRVSYFVPVILVRKDFEGGIAGLADLAKPGVRLGLGNPKACQVGRLSRRLFEKSGVSLDAIEANTVVQTATVNELGVQVQVGQVDAVIVWDAIAVRFTEWGRIVEVPLEANIVSEVAIAVLETSRHPALARGFAEFVTGEAAQAIFAAHGYRTAPPG
jgi:molybdate transport system substrate-binding protein